MTTAETVPAAATLPPGARGGFAGLARAAAAVAAGFEVATRALAWEVAALEAGRAPRDDAGARLQRVAAAVRAYRASDGHEDRRAARAELQAALAAAEARGG